MICPNPTHGAHQQDPAIPVLDVGRMDDGVQQQPLGIYQDMALLAFDLLAASKPGGSIELCQSRSTAAPRLLDEVGIGLALVELRYKSAPPHIRSARVRSRTHIPHSRA